MIHQQLNQSYYTKTKKEGPIAAKTYGGISWFQVQSKVERAQKIKGILNVFGVYDHTNDQIYILVQK